MRSFLLDSVNLKSLAQCLLLLLLFFYLFFCFTCDSVLMRISTNRPSEDSDWGKMLWADLLISACLPFRAAAAKHLSYSSCFCSPRVSTAGTSAVTHVFPLGAGKLCQTFITFQRVVTGAYRNTLFHFYCTPTTWLVKSYCFLSSKTLLSPLGTDTTQASVGPQRCHMVFSSIRTLLHVRKEQLRDVNENKSDLQA